MIILHENTLKWHIYPDKIFTKAITLMLKQHENKDFTNKRLWMIFSSIIISYYLFPLMPFTPAFSTTTFDNLDSVIPGFKILSESSKIFSDNSEIIPNMLNGLPRSAYSSEYNVLLWLYYFFTPQSAYAINEIIVHLVAFFSMYIFLQNYIIKDYFIDKNITLFFSSLYFSLLPLLSSVGLTIAILPLVTYSLLNIKNHVSSKWDWILLLFIPFYSSFIFLYVFYIFLAGVYLIWDAIKYKKINIHFFLALVLMGIMFLLVEYRLVLSSLIPSDIISHRTEFNIYYNHSLAEAYAMSLAFFLDGWVEHTPSLMMPILLPFILFTLLISLGKRIFNTKESIMICILFILLVIIDFWQILLKSDYTIPIFFILALVLFFREKEYKFIALLLIFQIFLALYNGLCFYQGFSVITEIFPFFKIFNISRLAFIQTFIWGIVLALSVDVIIKRISIGKLLVFLLLIFQIFYSFQERIFQADTSPKLTSFEEYYGPELFTELKKYLPEHLENIHFLNYGIEPAVAQYNGLYTVDGYSTNYPLSYKKDFRTLQEECFKKNSIHANKYKIWAGKLYLLCVSSKIQAYKIFKDKNITIKHIAFDVPAACKLHTDYLISSYNIDMNSTDDLQFIHSFKNEHTAWNIWLYKLECEKYIH